MARRYNSPLPRVNAAIDRTVPIHWPKINPERIAIGEPKPSRNIHNDENIKNKITKVIKLFFFKSINILALSLIKV